MIAAGAERIGTSAGIAIIEEIKKDLQTTQEQTIKI